jgi:curli production assembly/transport component CsgG
MPYERWTPLLFIGAGSVSQSGPSPLQFQGGRYLQAQGGLGVQFSANKTIGFRSTISYNQPFTDVLDGKGAGTRNDYYLRGTVGLVIHIGQFSQQKSRPLTSPQVAPQQATPAPGPTPNK